MQISHTMCIVITLLILFFSFSLSNLNFNSLLQVWIHLRFNLLNMVFCSMFMVFITSLYLKTRPRKIFLVDFSCYKPDKSLKCSRDIFIERSSLLGIFSEENLNFQKNILVKSGIGQNSYFPDAMWQLPPNLCMMEARKEAEAVLFGAIDELFIKTGVKAKDIGILIVNCSLFNPTPSLSATIANHYNLRCDLISYNLGGMGCSAGPISVDLAKNLLNVHLNTYALVISTENITLNWYLGNKPSMLVSNCLFRMGGAAMLLSNRSSDHRRSKYQLIHTVRTHNGIEDRGYRCAYQEEDEEGKVGVTLSKDLADVAADALRTNITTLGSLVLPKLEQLVFLSNLLARKLFKMKIKHYKPNFMLAIEHFCIHSGGRAVLDKVQNNLNLTDWHMEPSRMTLYRFGNTSSSSLWYELAYTECKRRVKKGDRVWQIAFGSGFKCNSAIWLALKNIDPTKEKSPWIEEIDEFPVYVPTVVTYKS